MILHKRCYQGPSQPASLQQTTCPLLVENAPWPEEEEEEEGIAQRVIADNIGSRMEEHVERGKPIETHLSHFSRAGFTSRLRSVVIQRTMLLIPS